MPDPTTDPWGGSHPALRDAPLPDVSAEPGSMVVPVDTGERIHYLDWGTGGSRPATVVEGEAGAPLPPVVLVHGIARTAWSWTPVARRLCGATRVLAVDLRGHGSSEAARAGYELGSLAFDVLTVLSANGYGADVGGAPAVVAGHGLGAMVAATMAALAPASLAGVALLDGGWEEIAETTRQSPSEFLAALAEPPEVLASMDAFLDDRRGFDPASWDADQERAARAQVEQKHAGHVSLVTRPAAIRGLAAAMYAYRPVATLARVAAPLLVLVAESGAADDDAIRERRLALEDVERARRAAGLAAARVVRLPGAGHDLVRHRPAEVAAELLRLVRLAGGDARPAGSSPADGSSGPAIPM